MANYYGSARSNIFEVKDREAFLNEVNSLSGIEIQEPTPNHFLILGNDPDGNNWTIHNNHDSFVDLPKLVSRHLTKDSIAIFMEAGAEKLRYLIGLAEAIDHTGERIEVSLEDIYINAKTVFGVHKTVELVEN